MVKSLWRFYNSIPQKRLVGMLNDWLNGCIDTYPLDPYDLTFDVLKMRTNELFLDLGGNLDSELL